MKHHWRILLALLAVGLGVAAYLFWKSMIASL